ncbi:protein FREE1-like [Malus sylvestris]|uniref:protein FREE1-like n=1 Tax=Malus sylvestris TaxID=3752 RepID=UPI0021ABB46B|nr:protein FREE1-like [Malus sylvestris]
MHLSHIVYIAHFTISRHVSKQCFLSYPLDTVTRCDKTDSSTFAFWSKSSVDIEPRCIRLQLNSNTANTLLDTVTAATVQVPDEAVTKCTACGSDFGAL